jgi:NADH:ubiquinone oxidoreductase subunit F (NADH-binding)
VTVTAPSTTGDRVAPVRECRLFAGWQDNRRADDLATHERRLGPCPRLTAAELVAQVEAAGLLGRGGGGFPTSRKLRAVAEAARPRRRPIVVANGCEGDPTSYKDMALLDCAPHLVLDGLAVAATALGAAESILCVEEGSDMPVALHTALAARDDPVPTRIVAVPARYVASEATALVNFLGGGSALPTTRPPRPAQRGVGGAPTLVDNVETLAHLALIARFGAAWFRSVGTVDLPGTLLVTIGGAVRRPGIVVERAAGTPLARAVAAAGGPDRPPQAVLSGGYGGTWIRYPDDEGPALSHRGMAAAGAVLGVPSLVVLPTSACGLAETARILRYLAGQSAGQCGPCLHGLPAIAEDMAVVTGATPAAARAAWYRLERRLDVIAGRGACGHPDGAVRLAGSALDVFVDDLYQHLDGRPCVAASAAPFMPIPREAPR